MNANKKFPLDVVIDFLIFSLVPGLVSPKNSLGGLVGGSVDAGSACALDDQQVYEPSPEICSWEKCGCFCGSQYVLVNHVMQEHIQPQVHPIYSLFLNFENLLSLNV